MNDPGDRAFGSHRVAVGAAIVVAVVCAMIWNDRATALGRVFAWPSVVLSSIYLFRREVAVLFDRLESLEQGKTRVQFAKGVSEASEAAEKMNDEAAQAGSVGSVDPDVPIQLRIFKHAEASPSGAVFMAWALVVEALAETAERCSMPNRSRSSVPNTNMILSWLQQSRLLNRDYLELVRKLQTLRNKLAHAPARELESLDRWEARQYIQSALSVAHVLSEVKDADDWPGADADKDK
jgi:hypothetical protein